MFKWERLDDTFKKQGIYTREMEKNLVVQQTATSWWNSVLSLGRTPKQKGKLKQKNLGEINFRNKQNKPGVAWKYEILTASQHQSITRITLRFVNSS